MESVRTYTWVFTVAQTNLSLKDETGAALVGAGQQMAVTFAKVLAANSNSVDVSARIGFAASALASIANDSANGMEGEFLSSGGIPRGGGEVNSNGGATIALGAKGEQPLLTCSVSTNGSIRVILSFQLLEAP